MRLPGKLCALSTEPDSSPCKWAAITGKGNQIGHHRFLRSRLSKASLHSLMMTLFLEDRAGDAELPRFLPKAPTEPRP